MMQQPFGSRPTYLDVELYRDAPFAEYLTRDIIINAEIRFPRLDPPVVWTAVVTDNDEPLPGEAARRATWSESVEAATAIPHGTTWEAWLDGVPVLAGEVRRFGDVF